VGVVAITAPSRRRGWRECRLARCGAGALSLRVRHRPRFFAHGIRGSWQDGRSSLEQPAPDEVIKTIDTSTACPRAKVIIDSGGLTTSDDQSAHGGLTPEIFARAGPTNYDAHRR